MHLQQNSVERTCSPHEFILISIEYQHSSPNQNLYSRYSMDCKERSEFWFMRKTSGFPVFTMEVIHQQLDGELIFQTGPQHMINSVRKVSSNCWESRTKQVKRRFNIIQMSNGCPGNLLRQASHASDEGDDQVDKAQGKT